MDTEERNIENLLIAYLNNELDERRNVEVERWIHESKKNEKVFLQTVQLWQASQTVPSPSFDTDKAWNKVEYTMKRKPTFPFWQKVAAVIVLVVGTYFAYMTFNATPTFHEIASVDRSVVDTLTDGSVITLNTNSSLQYTSDFNTDVREVELVGEAFFEIKRDTARKFIVNIDNVRVTVLGTSFNINSTSSDRIIVFVNSGTVLFEYRGTDASKPFLSTKLQAGDRVSYNKITHELENSDKADLNYLDLYWFDKNLIFEGTSLDEVSTILESVYKVDIEFSDSTSNHCMLTASFHDADISEVIEVIAGTFEFQVEKEQNSYLFIGKGCEKE